MGQSVAFHYEDEVDRLDLSPLAGEGAWVDILHRMGYGARQRIANAFLQTQINVSDLVKQLDTLEQVGKAVNQSQDEKNEAAKAAIMRMITTNVNIPSSNIVALLVNIKAWNLVERGGAVAPITAETLHGLDEPIAEFIMGEINTRNTIAPKAAGAST